MPIVPEEKKEDRAGMGIHLRTCFTGTQNYITRRLHPHGLGFKAHGRSKDHLQHKLMRSLIKTRRPGYTQPN